MPDSDLDYVKVVGRVVMAVGDAGDAGEYPDLVAPTVGGEVWFYPQLARTLAASADPPATILTSVIKAQLASDGTLQYNGIDGVWLVDLGSTKVNPRILRTNAAYRVEFKNIVFDGAPVVIPSFLCHPLPDVDNDISLMTPVPSGSAVPITQGIGVTGAHITGADLILELSNSTEVDAGVLPAGPGATDASVAAYVAGPGATKTALDAAYTTDADISGAVTAHEAAANPHPVYLTQAEGDAAYDTLGAAATEAAARSSADALLIPFTQKAAASGVATLDSGSTVPLAQIPASLKLPAIASTGLLAGGILSIGSPTSTFSVTAATGIFVDDTVPTAPVRTIVVLSAQTNIAVGAGGIGSHPVTYVGFDATGTVIQQTAPFTPVQRRTIIALGAVIHSNLTVVNAVNQINATSLQATNQLWDLLYAIGPINQSGNLYSASGANLSIKRSAGIMFKAGANWANSTLDPHNVITAVSPNPLTFRYRTQTGAEGSDLTVLDPSKYDLAGTITSVPGTQFSVQRVVLFSSGLTRIQYGQAVYANISDAITGIGTEVFTAETNIAENGLVRAYLVLRANATDLTNAAQAKIVPAARIGGVTAGGGGTGVVDSGVASLVSDIASATRAALSALYMQVAPPIDAQTGTTYTLALTDAGAFVTLTNASPVTLTVPTNATVAFPVGTVIEGVQSGAGQVTIAPAGGVTINATPGLKVAAQYGSFGLRKTATDTWLAYGRLSA